MYSLIKTHTKINPIRVIKSVCGTAVGFLSIFVENYQINNIDPRIKDALDMIDIIGNTNSKNIIPNDIVLVSFDVFNMFPSINNILGLETVSEILQSRKN